MKNRGPDGQRSTVSIQGFALRVIRKRSGLTSAELAHEIGCSDSYIRRIETGHTERVSEEFLGKLRRALDLENDDRRALLNLPCSEVGAA